MIRVIKKFLKILSKKQMALIGLISIMMLIGGVIESMSISLVLPLVTAVMDENGWNEPRYAQIICETFKVSDQRRYISILLLLLISLFVAKNLYLLFEYYVQYTFISKNRIQTIQNLMHSYLHKPYEYYLNASTGEILRIVSADIDQTFALLTSVLNFSTECFVSVIMGVTVIFISQKMAIVLICILCFEILILTCAIKPIMKRIGNRKRRESAITSKWMLESINGIKSIKVSSSEDFFEKNYIYHSNITANDGRKEQIISNVPRLFIETVTIAGVLSFLFVSIGLGVELSSLVPQLSAFAVAAVRLIPSANRMSTEMSRIPYFEGGLDNVIRNTDMEKGSVERSDIIRTNSEETKKLYFCKEIEFSHITFSYPGSEKKIFDDATFTIKKGQSVGIVGQSGAGKTTAIDIMLGLLRPEKGTVLVDGIGINDNMQGWLANVAYIPQNIFLIDDTIRANVGFGIGKKDISDDRVWEVLKEAQLESFVKELPEGINTRVGEAGVRISGGQRQRIGIARALYNNPEVLFFDEATSALDGETEAAIMESINSLKGNKTIVIIAHRLSTIENCDAVYCVENGKITPNV